MLRPAGTAPPTGLLQALRIQLADAGPVTDGGELSARELPARVSEAGARGRRAGARLALWAEPSSAQQPPGQGAVWLLYLVGQHEGRVLVDVVRVEGGAGPEVDRSLALKVREAHDAWGQSTVDAQQLQRARAPAATRWGYRVVLGSVLLTLDGSDVGQWGVAAAVGGHYRPSARGAPGRGWLLHGALQLRWLPGAQVRSPSGRVDIREFAPGLGIGAVYRVEGFGIGLSSGIWARQVRASGAALDGSSGEFSGWLWSVPLAIELQIRLAQHLSLRAAPLLEFTANPERFAIVGQVVTELPALRPGLELSLVLQLDDGPL